MYSCNAVTQVTPIVGTTLAQRWQPTLLLDARLLASQHSANVAPMLHFNFPVDIYRVKLTTLNQHCANVDVHLFLKAACYNFSNIVSTFRYQHQITTITE